MFKNLTRRAVLACSTSTLLALGACGGAEGTGPFVAAATPSSFSGIYSGNVTALSLTTSNSSDAGTFQAAVTTDGTLTGSAALASGTYALAGTVDKDGLVAAKLSTGASNAQTWRGQINQSATEMVGTWYYTNSGDTVADGTFSGKKGS